MNDHDSDSNPASPDASADQPNRTPPPLPAGEVPDAAMATPDALRASRTSIDIDRVAPIRTSDEDDTASRSLAAAMRTGFLVLKVLMVLLVVGYFLSGLVRIDEQELGVKVRFGRAVKELPPGLHFTAPFPFENVIRVKSLSQEASVNETFYYANENQQSIDNLKMRMTDLNPENDGSLIAADGGIVHARARVTFRVSDAQSFVENVGLARVGIRDTETGELITDEMAPARQLVESLLEQTLVELAAQIPSDRFYTATGLTETGRSILIRAQTRLAEMESGIQLDEASFVVEDPQVSPPVVDAFIAQNNAESERSQARSRAIEEATRALTDAAGAGATGLVALIDEYEDLQATGELEAADAVLARLMEAFENRRLEDGTAISGQAAKLVADAQGQRDRYVGEIQQEVDRFLAYVEQDAFKENPALAEARLAQELIRDVLSGELAEIFFLPPGTNLEIWLNRDPDIIRQKEENRLNSTDPDNIENMNFGGR